MLFFPPSRSGTVSGAPIAYCNVRRIALAHACVRVCVGGGGVVGVLVVMYTCMSVIFCCSKALESSQGRAECLVVVVVSLYWEQGCCSIAKRMGDGTRCQFRGQMTTINECTPPSPPLTASLPSTLSSFPSLPLVLEQVGSGAVATEAIRAPDGVRLRAHVERGSEFDVGRRRVGLLPVGHAQPQGHPLARDHLPQYLRLVSVIYLLPKWPATAAAAMATAAATATATATPPSVLFFFNHFGYI